MQRDRTSRCSIALCVRYSSISYNLEVVEKEFVLYKQALTLMADKKYEITQSQLFQLQHFKRMFELAADDIKTLCAEERADIVYGFRLGEVHSNLRQHYIHFMELEDKIYRQEIKNEKNT